ncbi:MULTISPECIES: HDOD domain-containing protein [unclassified Uliginosibacterium]|uniref:HDOD domain-containing protein n=1 Tax=unclassified Uliginosibacterium TaxID=2621521 RepID=UPI001304435B|nr:MULTISPECIES: HDOD domain-containing protein [unclassified Uliginosibacterium]MDO6387878.1 HDOD domain-containing protein [Uliginosibacterium sp. 31-12]
MSGAQAGVEAWVNRIKERDMPVFGRTVQEVRSVTEDDMASTARLSRAILQDAALTTKVLKLSNSVMFNPSRQSVNTISRAIVVLGFDLVGNIVLSIQLIDALLASGMRERVVAEMARCFHAAVQARTAARARSSKAAEEVFIATLLGRVGEMAFWCFGGEQAEQLDAAMKARPDAKPEELQLEVLGFRLNSLTAALARDWHLGPMVIAAAQPPANPDANEKAILHGYRLAHAVEGGWETPAARAALAEYADYIGLPLKDITEELTANAGEAARVAAQFGAEEAARLIPMPKGELVDIDAEVAQINDPAPDPMLQLKILRDLSMLLAGNPSLNDVLQLVLEGIYRGLGMSRAVFALQTADRAKVVGKVALGRDADKLAAHFAFPLDQRPGEIINLLFAKSAPIWLKGEPAAGLKLDRLEAVTGQRDCMLAPIVAAGRVIGFFYADRAPANPPDDETWQGFLHFAQQASLSFQHVASRGAVKK